MGVRKRGEKNREEREREKWSHWVSAENHPEQETQAHHTSKLRAQVRLSPRIQLWGHTVSFSIFPLFKTIVFWWTYRCKLDEKLKLNDWIENKLKLKWCNMYLSLKIIYNFRLYKIGESNFYKFIDENYSIQWTQIFSFKQ